MIKKNERGKKGFTLAELLIVVAIIGVLVAVAIPVFNNALNNARQATDDANIRAAYAQYIVTTMTASGGGNVPKAEPQDVRDAFEALGITNLEVYTTVTVPSNGSRWIGSGTGGSTVAALTVN